MIYSLTDTLPSSEVTVTETNLVSTQPKTSTRRASMRPEAAL